MRARARGFLEAEAEGRQVALVEPGLHRQQLNRRDAETHQMRDRGGMGEARETAAQWLRDAGMARGKATHVQFVKDRPWPAGEQ